MVGAIRASATPDRADRLFPGDIDQFRFPGGGLGLAHGAAGVLYALSEAVGVRVPEYEEWLVTRAAEPPQGMPLGLYDGLAGVAYTLARLGHLDAAAGAALICLGENWDRLGHSLYGGLSGFALAMISVGDQVGEPRLADAAIRAAEIVAAPYAAAGDTAGRGAAPRSRGAVGLLHGASGKALLLIRLYERTGDPAYLDAAEGAIADDLERCVTDGNGALQVDDGWRTLPYLGRGSVGIGMVIDQFTAHRRNAVFADAARAIRLAASSGFYAQAGLFNGRAGMIAYLSGTRDESERDAGGRVRRRPSRPAGLARRPVRGRPGVPGGHAAAPVNGPGHRHRRRPAGHGRRARPWWRSAAVLRPARKPPRPGCRVIPGDPAGSLQPASAGKEVKLIGSPRHRKGGETKWHSSTSRRWTPCVATVAAAVAAAAT